MVAKPWTAFHGAWEVLASCAGFALLAVLADAGAATGTALAAQLAVLAHARAATFSASVALLAVLTVVGAPTCSALVALFAVLADAGAAAGPAIVAPLAMRALLADAPLYWVRRRGGGRFCRNCCSCLRHGAKWQRLVANLAKCLLRRAGFLSECPWTHPPPTTCRAPGPLTWGPGGHTLRTTRRLGRLRRARRTVPK